MPKKGGSIEEIILVYSCNIWKNRSSFSLLGIYNDIDIFKKSIFNYIQNNECILNEDNYSKKDLEDSIDNFDLTMINNVLDHMCIEIMSINGDLE